MGEVPFGSKIFILSQVPFLLLERYDSHLCSESWEIIGKNNNRDLL